MKLPVEWNGIEINSGLEGREITENVLNPLSTIDLILAMHAFVAENKKAQNFNSELP